MLCNVSFYKSVEDQIAWVFGTGEIQELSDTLFCLISMSIWPVYLKVKEKSSKS